MIWVYVEGLSDKLGLEALLREEIRNWRQQGIGLRLLPLKGKGNLLREIGRKTRLALDKGGIDHVFALVDLFPGHTDAESLRQELKQRVESRWHSQFHAHVAVHDFEAWVLASREELGKRLGIADLHGFNSPEIVNDQKPPAEHLKELFIRHKRTYQKEVDGPAILRRTTPVTIARQCPNFQLFYQDLFACIEG
jgi:hypothetical protein